MKLLLTVFVVGFIIYLAVKYGPKILAKQGLGVQTQTPETPFWEKLLGAGAEQYRSKAFDPGEFIRDVTGL